LRSCEGVAEYRVEIRSDRALTEMSIVVEPVVDGDATLVHRLETALRNALALRIPVTLAIRGSLPRFEMKAQRWVRL
jgi:phenylacetate-coenzyme A ligase PaaK-like adenylate-forming protein